MHKISSLEVFVICFLLTCGNFPGFANNHMISTGRNSAIICQLISLLLGLIFVLIVLYLKKKFKGKNIFEFNKKNFKWFGTILNIGLIISIIIISLISSMNILNFTISQFLSRTSYYVVIAILFSIIGLAIIHKEEVIARSILSLFYIFVFTILCSWIGFIPSVEIDNLLPVFGVSTNDFIKCIITSIPYNVIPILLVLAIKEDNIADPKNYNKSIIFGYLGGSIFVTIFLFFIISIFGIDLALIYSYPEYSVFKQIDAFDFIQRIENILAVTIFIAFFTYYSMSMNFFKEAIVNTFNMKQEKKISITIFSICIIIPCISTYLFKNYNLHFIFDKFYIIGGIIIGYICFIAFLTFFKNLFIKN